jgi:hypothetical protein
MHAMRSAFVCVLLAGSATSVLAQPYAIAWSTVDGGGAAASTGGPYALGATIGQSDTGGRQTGGDFGVLGGFWAGRHFTITAIRPTAGVTAGGTRLSIVGTDVGPDAVVTLGGAPVTHLSVTGAMGLTARSPAHPQGVRDLVVKSGGETVTLANAFTYVDQPAAGTPGDTDGDGIPDWWELRFGLDPLTGHESTLDTDGDGRTDLQEYQQDTHPVGRFTRYLAEGATSDFFDMRLALLNVSAAPAAVQFRFLRSTGAVTTSFMPVNGLTRQTLDPETVLDSGSQEFSTVIEADEPIVVDRTMTWDGSGYGSHAETSVGAPSTVWYLAEGATHSGFDLFYLIQNPSETTAQVQVTYLLPAPAAPVVKTYAVAANSRSTIWVDLEGPQLAATDVSATVVSSNAVPIIVERAMYLNAGGLLFGAGHESAGVTSTGTNWFLAEGATGPYFDEFVLIANPTATTAQVRATYLLPGGTTVVKDYTVAANSRFTIWVDQEDPLLTDTAVSTTVASTNGVGIIVERAMWWPGDSPTWHEAHNSPGATATGTLWALAEGELGGATSLETYILIANTSNVAGSARVTLLFEDGTTTVRDFALEPNSRVNVAVAAEFPEAAGRRFGALIDSLGSPAAQIVVERAMYSSAGGTQWSAGTDAYATRLR